MTTKTLSRPGLIEMLRSYDGKQFWSVKTVTVPKVLKKGRETGRTFMEAFGFEPARLRKVCKMVIGMGYDYGTVVVHRLAKEDKSPEEFVRGTSWHCPAYPDSDIIRKNKKDADGTGQLYVAVNCVANNRPQYSYVDIRTGAELQYTRLMALDADGNFTEDEDEVDHFVEYGLKEFLDKKSEPKNQGLDNPVDYRVFKVEGIEQVTCNGVTYNITDV